MKTIKLIAFIGLFGLLTVGCANDDNSIIEKPDEQVDSNQKKVGSTFETTGVFDFKHAGANIPFEFTKTNFIVKTSALGQANSDSKLITLFINKENVNKAVLKQEDGKYLALFLRNIKENSMDINMDYTFDTEDAANKAAYPDPKASMGSHDGGQFGWLSLTKSEAGEVSIQLPINGKYIFDGTVMGGGIYSYIFTNENISFDAGSPYEMKILKHNKDNNKILLEGLGSKEGTFYVVQLKDITENTVKIARDTKTNKSEAETTYESNSDVSGNFTEYTKETNNAFVLPVNGRYIFDGTAMGGGIYSYTFTNEKVSFDAGSPYDMKITNYNSTTNKILLEGLGSKEGTFYVIQLKEITDASVKIARDTKSIKADAEATFNSSSDVAGNFTEYIKE